MLMQMFTKLNLNKTIIPFFSVYFKGFFIRIKSFVFTCVKASGEDEVWITLSQKLNFETEKKRNHADLNNQTLSDCVSESAHPSHSRLTQKNTWVLVEETVVDPYIDEWVLMKALDPRNTHLSPKMKPNALIYSYFYVIIL